MDSSVAQSAQRSSIAPRVFAILGLLFVFLMGVRGLGGGFRLLGEDLIQSFFAATENPFIGLVVGLFATTLVQSSSVTTSMIVGMVAAPENPLPLANAVPMVMGANIGTTVTSTIVSLAHLGRKEEFERAFPIAVCHDIFNYFAVLILLPLEIATGFLQKTAIWCTGFVGGLGGIEYRSPLRSALSFGLAPVYSAAEALFPSDGGQAVFLVAVSGLFIFVALYFLVKTARSAVHARVERFVNNVLGLNAIVSVAVGAVVTVMVQSSSITTSLLVPLGGAGLLKLERAFPVTIGANIGTTVTGFLAALAVAGPNAAVGLQIALVHLLFNVAGMMLIYPITAIRNVPLRLSRGAAQLALRSRKLTVVGIALLFYGLPALCIVMSRAW